MRDLTPNAPFRLARLGAVSVAVVLAVRLQESLQGRAAAADRRTCRTSHRCEGRLIRACSWRLMQDRAGSGCGHPSPGAGRRGLRRVVHQRLLRDFIGSPANRRRRRNVHADQRRHAVDGGRLGELAGRDSQPR
jgi:hypothetical protein